MKRAYFILFLPFLVLSQIFGNYKDCVAYCQEQNFKLGDFSAASQAAGITSSYLTELNRRCVVQDRDTDADAWNICAAECAFICQRYFAEKEINEAFFRSLVNSIKVEDWMLYPKHFSSIAWKRK